MTYETVDLRGRQRRREITLNRPERLNAWTAQFGDELREVITRSRAPEVRAVLITGAGRGFSSGADLKASSSPDPGDERPTSAGARERYHP